MSKFIDGIKHKFQWESFCDGYSKGYKYGVYKLLHKNGMYQQCRQSDMDMGAQYQKRPKSKLLYLPWKAGFDYGYTTAVSNYNVGVTDDNDPTTLDEIIDDVKHEYEIEKISWE